LKAGEVIKGEVFMAADASVTKSPRWEGDCVGPGDWEVKDH